jgi:hypothetical protein
MPLQRTTGQNLMIGSQGVGRGLLGVGTLLPDLSTAAANAVLSGTDLLGHATGLYRTPYRFKPISDTISDAAFGTAKEAGLPVVPYNDMSLSEKTAYNVSRFGTEAVGSGRALATAAQEGVPNLVNKTADLARNAPVTPKPLDPLVRPYVQNPTAATITDAAAGAGSGTGLTASQELPDSIREKGGGVVGGIADLAAMLVGGIGGGTLSEVARRAPLSILERLRGSMLAKDIPIDPQTGLPVSNKVADMASEFVQRNASNPETAAEAIGNRAQSFRDDNLPVPTSGLISDDPGLQMLERGSRVRGETPGAPFVQRDNQLRDAALSSVEGMGPQSADPRAFTNRAQDVADTRQAVAQQRIDQASGQARGVQMAREGEAANVQAMRGQGEGASRSIDEIYNQTRNTELQNSRQLYNDPALTGADVPVEPMRDAAAAIGRQGTDAAPLHPIVQKYVDRFAGLEDGRPTTMREINANKAELEADIAANLDNGAVVRQLRGLKDTAAGYSTALADAERGFASVGLPPTESGQAARAAEENFRTRVAPNFREGAGGEFDGALRRDRTGYNTRPSETADTFLNRTEDVQDLNRVGQLAGREADVTQNSRAYILDQLARTGVVQGDVINPQRLRAWADVNRGRIDAVPGLGDEINSILRRAQSGERISDGLAADVRTAQRDAKVTQQEIDRGALGLVLGKDPGKAIAAVMGSGDPQQALRELVQTVGKNPDALSGLKRAVADHVQGKITDFASPGVSEGTQAVNYGRLSKVFAQNERVLAEVFSPQEMNALRQAHKLLEPLVKRSGGATTGSPTAESSELAWRTLEAGLKLKYGVLKGGGLTRTVKIMASTLGDDSVAQAQRLVERMWFDPELAQHLLTRPAKEVGTSAYNAKLQRLLRYNEAAKNLGPEDDGGGSQ